MFSMGLSSNKDGVHDVDKEVEEESDSVNVKLKRSLNFSELCSESGTVFEIASNQDSVANASRDSYGADVNEFYDDNHLNLCFGQKNEDFDNSFSEVEDDLEPFEKLARNMENVSGDGGVRKMELQSGVGSDIPDGATVFFHYSAYLEYADEPFDSTLLRNKPQRARLNGNDTIPGLKIGLKTMRKREKARFLIKPNYAFGQMGCPPRIPADATILYEVTLTDAVDNSAVEEFENLDFEKQNSSTFEEKMKAAKTYHRQSEMFSKVVVHQERLLQKQASFLLAGNDYYRSSHLTKAKGCYRRAAWILENMSVKDAEQEKQQCEMIFKMHSNLAQVNLDLKEPRKACTECHMAFEVPVKVNEEMKSKVFFRYAKAKMYLNDYNVARKYLLKAQRIRPNNPEVSSLLEALVQREHKYNEREKIMYRKMLQVNVKETIKHNNNDSSPTRELAPEVSSADNSGRLTTMYLDVKSDGVALEMQNVLRTQVKHFADNTSRKELPLPSNLSTEELNFVSAVAKCLNVHVEKHHIGFQTLRRVVRL